MEKKQEFKINVGGSSIILIIVVFALAIFAVLSIKASNSDLVLAKKTRASVTAYYEADSKAETCLAQIDQILNAYKGAPDSKAIQDKLSALSEKPELTEETKTSGTITYSVIMNEYATLQVELKYQLKDKAESQYKVTKWNINQQDIGDYDFNNFEFWDGTIKEDE